MVPNIETKNFLNKLKMLKPQVGMVACGTLFLLLLYLDGCGCYTPPANVCEHKNVLFEGHNIKTTDNVENAYACHRLCEDHPRCHAWSYNTKNYFYAQNQKKCRLKNRTYIRGKKLRMANIVSGSRYCGDVCPMKNVIYEGYEVGKESKVTSWQKCRKKCQDEEECVAWSYLTKKFNKKYEHKRMLCKLKGDYYYKGEKAMSNVFSGSKYCKGLKGDYPDESYEKPERYDFSLRFNERDDKRDEKSWKSYVTPRLKQRNDESNKRPWKSYLTPRLKQRNDESNKRPWKSYFVLRFNKRDEQIDGRPRTLHFVPRFNRRDYEEDEKKSYFDPRLKERNDESDERPREFDFAAGLKEREDESDKRPREFDFAAGLKEREDESDERPREYDFAAGLKEREEESDE